MNVRLVQILLVCLILAIWEGGVRIGAIDTFYLSSPTRVFSTLVAWTASGFVWPHIWITFAEAAVGFLIGLVSGTFAAFVLATRPALDRILRPFLVVANALPRISFAPLIVLWFGLGFSSKLIIVWSLVFFVVLFNVYSGIKEVSPILIKNARLLGASKWQIFRAVSLPSSISWMFASLRVSVGFAVTGAVLGEYIGSSRGLGWVIDNAGSNYQATGVIAGLVLLTFLVLVFDSIVKVAERHLCPWNQTEP